jgi:GT2 family glycosyltransferase
MVSDHGDEAAAHVCVVILSMGNRPVELGAAIESVVGQADVTADVVVVANGVGSGELGLPDARGLRVVELSQNAGIPGGRNAGLAVATAPVVAFLDDDAVFIDPTVLARAVDRLRSAPRLGAIALRIVDEDGRTARRHVPRIGARDPARSGPVTAFLGGAVVLRTAAFRDVGGYAETFTYAMEETDIALRLIDHGWEIVYDGAPAVFHPATEPSRHTGAAERTMRNRVWLAHRNLPLVVGIGYVLNWLAISTLRRPANALTLARAVWSGWRTRPGPRAPIRWRTVARLTWLGRPPVI